ncbi:MAG: WYL domain-containing protein, partial [Bacteroidota bacterium]
TTSWNSISTISSPCLSCRMAEDKTRIARLSAILTYLQASRLVTARELAQKYNVSIRTIYRDMRTLEESGVPITVEEGKGYMLVEGYRLPPVSFTEEEAMAMITVEQLLQKEQDSSLITSYKDAVTKIKSVLGFHQKEKTELLTSRLQVRTYTTESEPNGSQHLMRLQHAITHFRLVRIDYVSLREVSTVREVEPFALYTTRKNWLLIAYCRKRSAFRSFRLERIQHLQILKEVFSPHEMSLEEYLEQSRKNWTTPDIYLAGAPTRFASKLNHQTMQKVQLDSFHFIGIAVRTSNEEGQAMRDIGQLWERFISQGLQEKIPSKTDTEVYIVYTDFESDHTGPYTTLLGCRVGELTAIPDGMEGRTFSGLSALAPYTS